MTDSRQARLTGVVLAGGSSRRMGRDKRSLRVAGVSLLDRAVRVLRDAGAEQVWTAGGDRPGRDSQLLADAPGLTGPLAGILAALTCAAKGRVLVLAVDHPRLESDWFAPLLDAATDQIGAAYLHDGHLQPLAACWPAGGHLELKHWSSTGGRSPRAWIEAAAERQQFRLLELPAHLAEGAKDCDTPETARTLGLDEAAP